MANLRWDHTELHRGLSFVLFAMSIYFIFIHWDERQSSPIAWLSLHCPCTWPSFGKISYFDWWLFALWADCGWDEPNCSGRAASPLSCNSSRAPSTSQPSSPISGASARPGSTQGCLTSCSPGHTSQIHAQELFPHPQRGLFKVSRLQCHL